MTTPDFEKEISIAVSKENVEHGIKIVDAVRSWDDMQNLISVLEALDENQQCIAPYLLGDIYFRYEDWPKAIKYYLRAAKNGFPSGFYLAAKAYEKAGFPLNDNNYSYESLMRSGSLAGHVWSKLVILRKYSDTSILSRFNYYIFRFVIAPTKILRSSINLKHRDQIRF